MMMVVIHAEDGGASETIYVVVHSEERGGMTTEERLVKFIIREGKQYPKR